MTDQLFAIDQEITPIHNSGHYKRKRMFGKIFHVSEYKWTNNHWYIGLKEFPPELIGERVYIEWWPQESFSELLPDRELNSLLCDIAVIYTHGKDPLIVCEPKTEV